MLADKAEISLVSSKRRIRVLIASGNPERIMLVRESLHAWPETVVCRVAVNVEDTVVHLESHAPHIICWDTGLGPEPPAAARGVCLLLLGEEACQLLTEPSPEIALPTTYVVGLQRSINREYELRRALTQLRDAHGSETQSRLLLARATDGIVVVDASRAVVFANPAACGLLRVESAASLQQIFEGQMPEEGKPAVYEAALANGTTSTVTGTAIASMWDGQEATIVQLQPALKPSVPPPVGPRVPEDRLRAIGRLAAGLAHEVNNPLTFVLANLESLRESHQIIRRFVGKIRVDLANDGELSPKAFEQLTEDANLEEVIDDVADMLTDCNKGMHRIQDIARSLGTFSRADDEQAELIDLARVVDDACAMVFNQIRYRARLVKRFEPIPMVAAYPGRIAQALVNMLTNAVEAIDGGPYEKHRIAISTRVENDHVIIGVSDTGVGIDKGHQDRIFTPGFTTKAHDGGMGLGLSLCKRVAEEHGGRVESHRLSDQGTRFELIIPIDTGLQPIERKRESRPISEAPATRSRILIVDDDAMVLSALRRRLRRRCETVTVLGGVEALARLAEDTDFDAIICDLMMPDVDGKSFYDTIQRKHPKLVDRVVFMSGGAFTPRLRKFAASVSNPVLQKPVTREHLESMLASIHEEASAD